MKNSDRRQLSLLVKAAAAGVGAVLGYRAAGNVGIVPGVLVLWWCAVNLIALESA